MQQYVFLYQGKTKQKSEQKIETKSEEKSMALILPDHYDPHLTIRETQDAIK